MGNSNLKIYTRLNIEHILCMNDRVNDTGLGKPLIINVNTL